MTIGELIQEFGERLYKLWPFRIVKDWESGVRVCVGRATALLTSRNGFCRSGLHICWPVIGEIFVDDTTVEVEETPAQTIIASDGVQVTFSLAMKFRIWDLRLMFLHIQDPSETLVNEMCARMGRIIGSMPHGRAQSKACTELGNEADLRLREWGVDLIDVQFMNYSRARPIRLIQD